MASAPHPRPASASRVAGGRLSRLPHRRLAAVGVLAVAIAVSLIVVSLTSGGGQKAQPAAVVGAARVSALLEGLPQQGTVLGSPRAPYRLVEYSDFQCPYCGEAGRVLLPPVIRDYVRTGRLQIEYRGLAFLGPDSVVALRTALAAGRQGHFWDVAELLFENQGPENSGWAGETTLKAVLAAVPGLDSAKALAARGGAPVAGEAARAESQAKAAGVDSTPAFFVGPRGGQLDQLRLSSMDAAQFEQALAAAMR